MPSQKHYDQHKRDQDSRRFYKSAAWSKVRELALKRDHYLCVECLKVKQIRKADVVHHEVEVRDDFTKALVLDNLKSICHAHHNGIHKSPSETKTITSKKINIIISKPNPEKFE